jgi:hypothetical protein
MVTLLMCGMLMAIPEDEAAKRPAIRLEGKTPDAPGEFGRLSILMHVPWLEGYVELRAPETLNSSQGLHFIDHNRSDMPPLSMLDPLPKWEQDEQTGAIRYWAVTKEGVEFGATATPVDDGVAVTMKVRNGTAVQLTHISCQLCLSLAPAKSVGQQWDLSQTYAWVSDRWTSLATTTPTPETIGRRPWLLMLTDALAPDYHHERVSRDAWWVLDQTSAHTLIARETRDGKHLVGIAGNETQSVLMTNTNIPCLHAGPVTNLREAPGEQVQWECKVYFVENDPAALLAAYRCDVQRWPETPAR